MVNVLNVSCMARYVNSEKSVQTPSWGVRALTTEYFRVEEMSIDVVERHSTEKPYIMDWNKKCDMGLSNLLPVAIRMVIGKHYSWDILPARSIWELLPKDSLVLQ